MSALRAARSLACAARAFSTARAPRAHAAPNAAAPLAAEAPPHRRVDS
jgi:uncharacterized membrane protein YgcG